MRDRPLLEKVNHNDDTISFIWNRELQIWLKLSFYNSSRMFFDLLPWMISLSLIGHKSTESLEALSIVEMWVYTWIVISWEFIGSTLSVLVSQALGYGSDGHKKTKTLFSMRSWLSLSIVVMTLFNVIVTILCLLTRPVLLALGFDQNIADNGSIYAYYIIPAVFFEGINNYIVSYLSSIQLAWPSTCVCIVSVFIDFLTTYLLIYGPDAYDVPLKSSAIGWVVPTLISLFLNSIIVWKIWGDEFYYSLHGSDEAESQGIESDQLPRTEESLLEKNEDADDVDDDSEDSYHKMSFNILKNIFIDSISRKRVSVFTKLAVPNFASSCVGNLSFLCISFLCAKLGNQAAAVHNTSIALLELSFTIVRGFAESTVCRLGYHIGAGNIDGAKKVLIISVSVTGLIASIVGYTCRYQLAQIMTNDPALIQASADLSFLLWTSYLLYSVGSCGLAALEGPGKVVENAILSVIGQWGVTVPIAFCSFFFTDWNLRGIWFAMMCGYSVTNILVLLLLYFQTDWDKIVEQARSRQYQDVSVQID